MIRALIGAAVGTMLLSGCGYDGWVRYECQEYKNWQEPQCLEPQCKVTGTCTKDLITVNE
jgi:hypothetical protein